MDSLPNEPIEGTGIDIRGSNLFVVFVSNTTQKERERICKDRQTFIEEFIQFREQLPTRWNKK
jgi:hypothetical protein